jgi:hypothetical protein
MLPKNVTRNHRLVRLRIFSDHQVPPAYLQNCSTVGADDPATFVEPPTEKEIEQQLLAYYMKREGITVDDSIEWQPVIRKEAAAAATAAAAASASQVETKRGGKK